MKVAVFSLPDSKDLSTDPHITHAQVSIKYFDQPHSLSKIIDYNCIITYETGCLPEEIKMTFNFKKFWKNY